MNNDEIVQSMEVESKIRYRTMLIVMGECSIGGEGDGGGVVCL